MALHEILPSDPRAPRTARHSLARFLARAEMPQLIDDAELLVTELVTNAVRHARGPIEVNAYMREGFLRLEVCDYSADKTPLMRQASPDDEGGRGIALVNRLSARWGWWTAGDTKVVWLDLPA
jgi:anti-sigma regulatory factor (Ser/Thr protein kinase)